MPKVKKKTRGKRDHKKYTTGQINAIIDDVCHPFFAQDQAFRILDGLMHAIAEQDPPVSAEKFTQFNLPAIIKMLTKKRK